MKKTVLYLLLFAFLPPSLKGQTFAFSDKPVTTGSTSYSTISFREQRYRPRPGAVAITGGILMAAGSFTAVYGVVQELDGYYHGNVSNQQAIDNGKALQVAGLVMFIAGTGMVIGGAIHDHSKARHRHWSLASPCKNEAGLAYNF